MIKMPGEDKNTREPLSDISELDGGVRLTVELPGVPQDAIRMAVSGDILKLDADGSRGKFSTIQALPFEPDPDRISVTFSQGVLEVILRKRDPEAGSPVDEKAGPVEEAQMSISLESMEQELERMKAELSRVSVERSSLEDRVHLLQRDFRNIKRRHEEEKEALADTRIQEVALGLIEVLDTFSYAKGSIKGPVGSETNHGSILKGIEMVELQVKNMFNRIGISPITSKGQPFDPEYHEAVGFVERSDLEDDMVAEEIRKGYIYKGKAVRPSQVIVNKKPPVESNTKDGGRKKK
ncbi:MAG: nucleotide exchange factor GrpE [Thermoplasmatota archaeon]